MRALTLLGVAQLFRKHTPPAKVKALQLGVSAQCLQQEAGLVAPPCIFKSHMPKSATVSNKIF